MFNISHRVITARAPVAQENSCQSILPSAWQLQKRLEQIFELQQQIYTTSPECTRRARQLQKKLKQVVKRQQQGLTNRPKSTLNPSAPVWSPLPASSTIKPKVSFSIPEAVEQNVHQEHRWGPGGLNPYMYKLLGSSLLDAIKVLGDSTPFLEAVNTVDYDDIILGSPVLGTPSTIDSGYESRDSNFSSVESQSRVSIVNEAHSAAPHCLQGQEYLLSLLRYAPGHSPKK